ncbi:NADH dehydrogenase [ubiquinone] 1 alpha subcomplex subunit 5 [Prorops nasuta]|uniref:NADH dehydrogenase [ubiquinone] 1 alpha subcomplex subunit 5 n=1 Tax=Prorops nasuta TaxID=863751 RepID=UPI0034CD2761
MAAKDATRLAVAVNKVGITQLLKLHRQMRNLLVQMPENYLYRTTVEQLVNERDDILKKTTNIQEVEKQMQSGQIEEIIHQFKREVDTAKRLIEYKAWEPFDFPAPEHQWTWPPTSQ